MSKGKAQKLWEEHLDCLYKGGESVLEDLRESIRNIYDHIQIVYAYNFHSSTRRQLLVEYKGERKWLMVDYDDGLVYEIGDNGELSKISLGHHEYSQFFEYPRTLIGPFFGLDIKKREADDFGAVIMDMPIREMAKIFKEEDYNERFETFEKEFDVSKIRLVREDDQLFLILPDGEKIEYKHLSEI